MGDEHPHRLTSSRGPESLTQVKTGRELATMQAVEKMLVARGTLRAARADFIAAVKVAREVGVPDGELADAMLRDSVAHDDSVNLMLMREALL